MMDVHESFFPLIALSAATLVGGLALLQSDRVSRRILNSQKLETKRRGEYRYQWTTVVDKVKLQLDYYLAGGIEQYKEDPEYVMKNRTTFVSNDTDMDDLIRRILMAGDNKQSNDRYFALKIDKDPHDPSDDYFLFLAHEKTNENGEDDDDRTNGPVQLYEVPLVKFGLKLAQAFEDQLTTTALCFVADASSGKASSMLEDLVKESKSGVAVVSEPFWMVQIAGLAEASLLTKSKIQKLMFALSRLDAWSVRNQVKGDAKTVMFTLPGQSSVPTLLPLVQAAFPQDRHVFAYDGCVASVRRGIYAKKVYKRGKLQTTLSPIINGLCQDPILHNTPFPSSSPLTMDTSLSSLSKALGNVPVKQAQVVETWISSVDAYFKLKEEENTNGYLPFCFKVGFLTDNPKGNFEAGTDSFWSLTALLQFIMGCRSRGVPTGVLDAGKEWLKDYNKQQTIIQQQVDKLVPISESERKMIENCCFQHKLILIGNKTLQDTVLPREHWTLKQATRAGCSCCGPDPYEQMEEEDADETKNDKSTIVGGIDLSSPGAFAVAVKPNNGSGPSSMKKTGNGRAGPPSSGYVDGKMGFAFDPTRF